MLYLRSFPIAIETAGDIVLLDAHGTALQRKAAGHRVVRVIEWDGYEGWLTDLVWDDGETWTLDSRLPLGLPAEFTDVGIRREAIEQRPRVWRSLET